jgi:hypothetical protein
LIRNNFEIKNQIQSSKSKENPNLKTKKKITLNQILDFGFRFFFEFCIFGF